MSPSGITPVLPFTTTVLLVPFAAPAGMFWRNACTVGRVPARSVRMRRPSSVGAPVMVDPEPKRRSVQRSNDPKANVLFLMMGPPNVPPN